MWEEVGVAAILDQSSSLNSEALFVSSCQRVEYVDSIAISPLARYSRGQRSN